MDIKFKNTPINDKSITPEFVLRDALGKALEGKIKNIVIMAEFEEEKGTTTAIVRSMMSMEKACFLHRIAGLDLNYLLMKDRGF